MLSVLTIVAIAQETPARPADLPWPSRPLEWKDVNFLSTSDTHGAVTSRCAVMSDTDDAVGWLLGHQHVRLKLDSVTTLTI